MTKADEKSEVKNDKTEPASKDPEQLEYVYVSLSKNSTGPQRVMIKGSILDKKQKNPDHPEFNKSLIRATPTEQEGLRRRGIIVKKADAPAPGPMSTKRRNIEAAKLAEGKD